jgi:hypothetical protein
MVQKHRRAGEVRRRRWLISSRQRLKFLMEYLEYGISRIRPTHLRKIAFDSPGLILVGRPSCVLASAVSYGEL